MLTDFGRGSEKTVPLDFLRGALRGIFDSRMLATAKDPYGKPNEMCLFDE